MGTLLRVLIVEDSEEDTLLVVRELKRGGFDPIHERVETAEAMKAALSKKTWDLILADYSMPHFSGLEALKLLKASGLDLPFIIISGSIGEDVAVEAMKSGAHDYLMKNNLTRLVPAMQQELREAEVRRRLKVSQNALQESEKRYRKVVENATEIIYTVDVKGNFTYANPAGLKVTGYSLAELRSFNYADLVLPEHRERVMEIYINQFRQRIPTTHVEFPFISKTGKIIWFSQNSSLVIEDGKVMGFHIIARDITERKKAQQALAESEQRYRNLVENAPDVIFTLSTDGTITSLNPTFEIITGWSRSDWMHKHFVSILHPDDLPRGLELFQRIMNGEKIAPFELRVLSKSGDYLVAEFTITTQTQNGSVINILGIARDVTERQRAEDALRAEKERFRLAAESSTDLIYEWDIKERVDWFGKFDEILGYAPNEFPRTLEQWANSIHPDDRDRVGAAIKNHLEKNEPYDIEYRIKKKDGTYNYWWGRGTSLRDGKGNPYLWIGSVTDITERKRAEEQLRLQSAALEAAANAIIITDCEGVIEWANRAFTSLTGYPFAEVIGRNPRELVKSGEQSQAFYKGLWDTILAGKVWRGQIINHRKDGSLYTEEMTITPLRNERGEGIRFIAIKQDITARKRAEEALRSSEEKYRNILESIEDGYYEVDTAGNFTFFNDSMCRIYGYPREELIGMNNRQYTDQENAKKLFQAFNKVYRTGESTREFDWEIIRKDGTKRYVETSVSLIKDSPGNKIGFRGVVRDITERKRAEEALQRSEEEARRLAQENTVVAEIGRIISSTLDINEVYEAFSAEVKKIIPFDRVVINMIDTEKNTVQNVYMAGKELQDRNVKDIYPLEGSGNAEMVRTKSTLLIQTEDFSEYKDRLPMLLSTFQAGFRSVMNVPLFSKGEIIGGLLLRSQKPYAYTDKEVKLAERIASQIAGAVANAQLYTERIQAEKEREALQEQLRQSQKMEAIGQLAGGVAHDFNNLLTVIKGYSQLSLGETKEGDPLKENIEEIKKAADRAVDLTRQLLAFSRRQIMEMKVLDINTNLQNLEKMLKRIIGEDVELVFLLNKDLGRVRTDPGQIEQVVLNLAVNARDAMPHGGKLTIETDNVKLDEAYAKRHIAVKPGPYVMLSVSDTGVGMTPEVRDRVFEPFFTTKAKGKGTGLGLSTVYGIVKQSGGNIWVYSELGKGTTFKIYLPMVEEILEEVEQMVMKEEPSRGSETILLVEDDEEVRKLAVRILEKRGYRVLKASKGEEALSLCKKQQPIHLMVTDVVMPGMGGRELTNRLKDSHPEMKVLYMSGYTDNAIVHHGVLEKGMNFIQKPFTVDSLTRKVREILDK